jgi:formylglycine-generating enzyme required for sulfatase activity
LRRDPFTGLWEFLHTLTGEEPGIDPETGVFVLEEETGVILVLVPGGTFLMGAQPGDPDGPNYDPNAVEDEGPVHEVTLDPFFLSKYEMSQGQWQRVTGYNDSAHNGATAFERLGASFTLLHPIETVSWEDCDKWLPRMGLTLPTEAQWEFAARAGSDGAYGEADFKESLYGAANIADQSLARYYQMDCEDWDDGSPVNWAVDQGTPNAFGLYNTIGNVWEICRDYYGLYDVPVEPGTGLRQVEQAATMVGRGACCIENAQNARICHRGENTPKTANGYLGVRPARLLGE